MPSAYVGICYSGYRSGQSPDAGVYPSRDQVVQDLTLVARTYREVRIYDAGPHADLVLDVIDREGLDLSVMLGAYLQAEASNPDCPWGGVYDEATLEANRRDNEREVERAIALAKRYASLVTSVAVGNEAAVSWTDHKVPTERIIELTRRVKAAIAQPVTCCDNHVPWLDVLEPLVPELDFISLHSYPVWENRSIDESIAVTHDDHARLAARYPGVPLRITEAGWTTRSNGRGIDPSQANADLQTRYVRELERWAEQHEVLTYVFEAFDEPWKGSDDPDEPEKHWGLFTEERRPKPVLHDRYPELVR